jgi:hypothetical protein
MILVWSHVEHVKPAAIFAPIFVDPNVQGLHGFSGVFGHGAREMEKGRITWLASMTIYPFEYRSTISHPDRDLA